MRELLQADQGPRASLYPLYACFYNILPFVKCFPHRLQGKAGRAGAGGGRWKRRLTATLLGTSISLLQLPRWIFFLVWIKIYFSLFPQLYGILTPCRWEGGDLTKWDIEQVFGTITCLLKTPPQSSPPLTEISFYQLHSFNTASTGSSLAPQLIPPSASPL